jgi:thioredoxin reductase (NADPH)
VLHSGSTLTCTAYTPARPAAARATLLVRAEPLAASMSDYLTTQLKATPKSGSAPELPDGHGHARLQALALEDVRTGQREQVPPRPSS